jgi:hypothetical protein
LGFGAGAGAGVFGFGAGAGALGAGAGARGARPGAATTLETATDGTAGVGARALGTGVLSWLRRSSAIVAFSVRLAFVTTSDSTCA